MGPNQTWKLRHSKRNHKQDENLQNGKKYLPTMLPTWDKFPKYVNSLIQLKKWAEDLGIFPKQTNDQQAHKKMFNIANY